jgi:hypothetical protein
MSAEIIDIRSRKPRWRSPHVAEEVRHLAVREQAIADRAEAARTEAVKAGLRAAGFIAAEDSLPFSSIDYEQYADTLRDVFGDEP